MINSIVEQARAIQESMTEPGKSDFLESELEDLRFLIRRTVEFSHFFRRLDVESLTQAEVGYADESIFSAVNSFCNVSAAYRTMTGQSTPAWSEMSIASLKKEFFLKYQEFVVETSFEKRCRLLLELFKLQIVYAGLSYG